MPVILATAPGFRPMHFAAAVEAGKHVFFEKPVAVDPAGIRLVMKAGELAKQKKKAEKDAEKAARKRAGEPALADDADEAGESGAEDVAPGEPQA